MKIGGLWMGSSVAERLIFVIRGSMVRVHPRPHTFDIFIIIQHFFGIENFSYLENVNVINFSAGL